ncbi:MAG: diguanylate cyclase [Armatimonadota bacterium]|jgi:diguanylate cyclase (GGDEF)-like protein
MKNVQVYWFLAACLAMLVAALIHNVWVSAASLTTVFCLIPAYILTNRRIAPLESLQSPRYTDDLDSAYRCATVALASAIGAKDSYISPIVKRVPLICELIARQLNLSDTIIERIRLAALIRDVGKLGVPDHILLKPGPLDSEEFAKMRNHAAIGANLLRQENMPCDIVEMVLYHHENFDGTGYPEQLSGENIPLGSRIISVAVVYDALVSDRCYRSGWTHNEAVSHLENLSGSAFDPAVVEAFLAIQPQLRAAETMLQKGAIDGELKDLTCPAVNTIAQANKELISLFDLAQTLSSTLEIDEVLALLAHRTRRMVQGSTCVVFMRDKHHPKRMVANTAVGRFEDAFSGTRVRYGKGITGRVAKYGEPRSGHFDPNDLIFNRGIAIADLDFKSCVSVPMVSFGEVLGTINIYDVIRRTFTDDELRILAFVAHQAAIALQNARAFEEARDFALRDPLTDLRNGRFLQHYLERELKRSSRFNEPLSVLGIDLDNFKGVNDLKGHEAGDRVLKDIADIFRDELRDYDVVARNGGDEFVAVLPETGCCEANRIAERIRQAVERYARQFVSDVPRFGLSIGVATFPADGTDTKALLACADAAMYAEKKSRRQVPKAA